MDEPKVEEATKLFEDELRDYKSTLTSIAISRVLIVSAIMILVAGSLRIQYSLGPIFWLMPFMFIYLYATLEWAERLQKTREARDKLFELTRIELMKSLKLKSSPSNEPQSNS